jgi:hypothetical protein
MNLVELDRALRQLRLSAWRSFSKRGYGKRKRRG